MLNLFSNLFLKTPSIEGWLDGRPFLVSLIENLFKQVHDWVEGMSYTLDSHCVFNWYHNWYFVYSYLFIYMYASTSNSINFNWYLIFHIYIYVFWLCLLYLYIFKHKFCYAKFDLVLKWQLFFNWYLIQAYASFSLVFHKRRKKSCFTFQSFLFTFCILLPLFMLKMIS